MIKVSCDTLSLLNKFAFCIRITINLYHNPPCVCQFACPPFGKSKGGRQIAKIFSDFSEFRICPDFPVFLFFPTFPQKGEQAAEGGYYASVSKKDFINHISESDENCLKILF